MIEFKVSTHGAELQSLQKDGKEYLEEELRNPVRE
jgi:hypothetical protein